MLLKFVRKGHSLLMEFVIHVKMDHFHFKLTLKNVMSARQGQLQIKNTQLVKLARLARSGEKMEVYENYLFKKKILMQKNQGICQKCPHGKISKKKRAVHCDVCGPGETSSVDNTVCISCKAGKYSSGNGDGCLNCPHGRFSPEIGSAICNACQKGSQCDSITGITDEGINVEIKANTDGELGI